MPEFDILYAELFDSVTEAIGEMEQMNFGKAKELLARSRQRGLEACFSSDEYKDVLEPFRTPAHIVEWKRRKRRLMQTENFSRCDAEHK